MTATLITAETFMAERERAIRAERKLAALREAIQFAMANGDFPRETLAVLRKALAKSKEP